MAQEDSNNARVAKSNRRQQRCHLNSPNIYIVHWKDTIRVYPIVHGVLNVLFVTPSNSGQ